MERTQKAIPVFFSKQLFELLGISPLKRAAAQSRIEYLRMKKAEIESFTMGKIIRQGQFYNALQYAQYDMGFGSLLCVFGDNDECCRAYFFNDISAN